MKWFRWIYRCISILLTIVILAIVAWIFWPTPLATEQEMLRLVPTNAVAVFIQRDVAAQWPAFKSSGFFKAWQNSPLMPVRMEGDSVTHRMFEQAMLDLFGKRIVGFLVPGANGSTQGGLCALVPITPRVKWLWVRAMISQHLSVAGFTIKSSEIEGHRVNELQSRLASGMRLRFARFGDVAALAGDWSGDSLADLVRSSRSKHPLDDRNQALASEPPSVLHGGWWEQPVGLARWSVTQSKAGTLQFDLTLPKQRKVRLPWDATRAPRNMALIQKLFPDQGLFTVRGRASHWMTAWDNVVAWCGLPIGANSENLIARVKYGEHLSHGLFPWSGAGDEFALVVAPASKDTLTGWPMIIATLRCWEPGDTQMAIVQLFKSLEAATKQKFPVQSIDPDHKLYLVREESQEGQYPLFYYRYADGLVMAGNSPSALQRFEPAQFDGQRLETVKPENELFCKPDEIGAAVKAFNAIGTLTGSSSDEMEALGEMMRSFSQLRMVVLVEAETVNYRLEVQTR